MTKPIPFFDVREHMPDPFLTPPCLPKSDNLPHQADVDYKYACFFLYSYEGSKATFNAYRREIERLLQWTWIIQEKTLPLLRREDIEQFVRFCQAPPKSWIGCKTVPRFISQNNIRKPNPEWYPFVSTVKKHDAKKGVEPKKENYQFSQSALKSLFAILSSFFNFLIQEEYAENNPVSLIRQKSKFITSQQEARQVRRLSNLQWDYVLESAQLMAKKDPHHERTLFIMSCLFGMYLRISELVADERHTPIMGDFTRDMDGNWWFNVIGKGNKERAISVSDSMIDALKRYRKHLNLIELPTPGEKTPLIASKSGKHSISNTRYIRKIVQECFDFACDRMKADNLAEEASELEVATVHWLRHTGISEDVKIRPIEHVRDDAGHATSVTTDRYVNAQKRERHASARNKNLKPAL